MNTEQSNASQAMILVVDDDASTRRALRVTLSFGDLVEAHPLGTVVLDGSMVQFQRVASDVAAFEPGAPHAGAHSLNDQVAFKLGHGANNNNDGPAEGAASVDVLPKRDLLDVEPAELI